VLLWSEECVAAGQENSRSGKTLPRLEDAPLGYDASVDWWSYGAMLYEMTYGLPPFYADAVEDTYKKIVRCTVCSRRDIAPVFLAQKLCIRQDPIVTPDHGAANPSVERLRDLLHK
jgi:serine/threonine protein kinase